MTAPTMPYATHLMFAPDVRAEVYESADGDTLGWAYRAPAAYSPEKVVTIDRAPGNAPGAMQSMTVTKKVRDESWEPLLPPMPFTPAALVQVTWSCYFAALQNIVMQDGSTWATADLGAGRRLFVSKVAGRSVWRLERLEGEVWSPIATAPDAAQYAASWLPALRLLADRRGVGEQFRVVDE